MRNRVLLGLIAALLGYVCFAHGGVTSPEWSGAMIATLLCALFLWFPYRSSCFAPSPHPVLLTALLLGVAFIGLQLLPLPPVLLATLDPTRAEIAAGLNGLHPGESRAWVPLSVAPALTFAHLQRVLTYLLIFLMARELGWRMPNGQWRLANPVIVVGTLEAALGIAQHLTGAPRATGTWVNPNHYADALHMALPLTALLAVRALRRNPTQRVKACLLILSSAAMLLGSLFSLSRMGLATILICGLLATGLTLRRSRIAGLIPAAVLVCALIVVPGPLLDRFGGPNGENTVDSDLRSQLWHEAAHLAQAYPLFGCGLGTYGSAIQKYRASAPLGLVEHAHNDYLETWAELGALGSAPWALSAGWIFFATWRKRRLLAAACALSLTAIALDSLVDFNVYIPANMMIAAWIAGTGSSLGFRSASRPTREPHLRS
jgi:O-antigen ligase